MRNSVKILVSAAALTMSAAALAPALYARDPGNPDEEHGSMMGSGMMEHDSMMNMVEQMSEMMDGCNKMMQGAMNDGAGKPNEQWQEDTPTAPDTDE